MKSEVSSRVILEKVLKMGLSTTRPQSGLILHAQDQFSLNTVLGCLDLVKLGYKSGFFSQARLLQGCPEDWIERQKAKNKTTSPERKDTLSYLIAAATNPRPLQDLCVLVISARLGYRSRMDRTAKAQTLGLPTALQAKVLFQDIVEDFLNDRNDVSPEKM